MSLFTKGGSDVEVKALIYKWRGTFSNGLWDRWLLEEPVFSKTIKKGRQLSEAWWHELGRQGSSTLINVNPTMWIFNMKNRFKWADRTESKHKHKVKITKVERTIVKADDTNG